MTYYAFKRNREDYFIKSVGNYNLIFFLDIIKIKIKKTLWLKLLDQKKLK